MAFMSKSSCFVLVFALLLSTIVLEACPTCAPTKKPPPPPPASSTTPCPPPPSSTKKPSPPTPSSCPRDALKLGVCANLLGLVGAVIGSPPSGSKCCALLNGLADLDAAVCLCTAIKANVLGLNLNIPVSLGVLLSACQKTLPSGYTCK